MFLLNAKWVILGLLVGGLTVAFFSSEGLVQFYQNGMGSAGSNSGSGAAASIGAGNL